ncbi:hypothetical protein ACFL6S_23905, partial [Candidatus Poribacteria bacterium]
AGGGVSLAKREYPARRVRITSPYYMGTYELTWDIWDKVMGTSSPKGPRLPALVKTDKRITKLPEFIHKLNETIGKKEKLTFRLAQWAFRSFLGRHGRLLFLRLSFAILGLGRWWAIHMRR